MKQFLGNLFLPDASGELDQRSAALIEDLAHLIVERRLETPAIFFLEMNKPLAFLAGQSLLLATPLLGAFLPPRRIEEYCRLLDSQDQVERLICRIEDLAQERAPAAAEPGVQNQTAANL